jgi:nucleoside-diphosphate-sugar epimerase
MTMRALVTGHKGFLGRHFAAELARRGYGVTGLDILDGPSGDCRTLFASPGTRDRFDLVVHCAAVVGGRARIDGSPLSTAVNLELDSAMFRWASLVHPGRVLYLSSSAAYPVEMQCNLMSMPLLRENWLNPAEGTSGTPDRVYGWSKVVGEVLAGELRLHGVPVTVVRPFSGYGADQNDCYPFPAFTARARKRADPFTVWGDGSQVRDFIHVDDVVAGALAVAEDGTDQPVNLCTGTGTSFDQLAGMVTGAAGYLPELRHLDDAPTGVRHRVGDPGRMLRYYTPKVSLEDGIRRALTE